MDPTTLADALEVLSSMEEGRSYSLRPEDPKRRLADDLARLGRELSMTPVVIGGLAVNHQLRRRAAQRLRTTEARRRLDALVRRAREELARRRR